MTVTVRNLCSTLNSMVVAYLGYVECGLDCKAESLLKDIKKGMRFLTLLKSDCYNSENDCELTNFYTKNNHFISDVDFKICDTTVRAYFQQ